MIPLFVENGVANVWNAEDWFILRTKFRICGALIGSLPSFPRQNDFMGLPVALMSEEAALLAARGICELYEFPNIANRPTEMEKQNSKAIEEKILCKQTEALKKRRIAQLSQKIDIIVAGKRQKLLSKGDSDKHIDKQTLLQEEINKLPPLAPSHALVHLPTRHHINTEKVKVGIEALHPSVTKGERVIHFTIFSDLWEQGHYITSGSKFGSDYLLYPGDPVKFHAMYMVWCVKDRKTSFRPINLIAFGRLSVSVNKTALIAYSDDSGNIQYQSLKWHDNNLKKT